MKLRNPKPSNRWTPRKPSKHAAKPKNPKAPLLRRGNAKERRLARQSLEEQLNQFMAEPEVTPHADNEPPRKPTKAEKAEAAKKKPGFKITQRMLNWALGNQDRARVLAEQVFSFAKPMPGVVPAGAATLAMDDNLQTSIGWAAQSIYAGAFAQGVTFMGYPYLSELLQRAEYRRIVEIIATEMTREWIEIEAKGDDADDDLAKAKDRLREAVGETDDDEEDAGSNVQAQDDIASTLEDAAARKSAEGEGQVGENAVQEGEDPEEQRELAKQQAKDKRVAELEEEFERFAIKDLFAKCAAMDGGFGRAHLFVDMGDTTDEELKMPIGDGQNKISQYKLAKGSIKRFKTVEPVWTYPANYNSSNPLRPDWYKPELWFVMGKEVHATRLLTFIGREVPDLLKPAYAFGGLALTQMAKPCVDNWLTTRGSVGSLIQAFSTMILSTNMGTALQPGESDFAQRAAFFNITRSNRGMVIIDKDTEDYKNVSAPLSGLSDLQAQSQEHICSVTGIPLVKYTGISPTGLNATSEFEMQAFYEWISAFQEVFFRPNLTRIFHMLQINLWGKVDPGLSFKFKPLMSLSPLEEAQRRKAEADTDAVYTSEGIIDKAEVRKRLSEDADGPYAGVPPDDVPEPPEPDPSEMLFGPGGMKMGGGANGEPDPSVAEPEA